MDGGKKGCEPLAITLFVEEVVTYSKNSLNWMLGL